MKSHTIQNQNGLTLIEVLLAFAILSIVFMSFLLVFPQASKYNKKTDNRLTGVTLAMQQMAVIQNEFGKKLFLNYNTSNPDVFLKSNPDYQSLPLIENIVEETNHFVLKTEENQLRL